MPDPRTTALSAESGDPLIQGSWLKMNEVIFSFHHIGIPTLEKKPGERYGKAPRMYTSDASCQALRIQSRRFEPDSPLHLLIQTAPHAAFRVDDLERPIAGWKVLLGAFEPIPEYRVAIIEDGGYPIESVLEDLADEQLWGVQRPTASPEGLCRSYNSSK